MKKLIVFACLIAFVVGCKKDDKEDKSIIGSWAKSKVEWSDCPYESMNGTEEYDADGCYYGDCHTLVITESTITMTNIEGGYTYTDTYPYTVDGSTLTLDFGDVDQSVEFDLSGDILVVDLGVGEGGCKETETWKRK